MEVRPTRPAQRAEDVIIERNRPRPTPRPAGERFRDSLDGGSTALLEGVEAAASLVPGGAVVSAAVRRAGEAASAAGSGSVGSGPAAGSGGPGAGSLEGALAAHTQDTMRFLELQQRISSENRQYTALSNVLKARHETAKAAINNIR